MIVAVQTLIYFRESLLTVLERLIGPYYKRLRFSKNITNNNLDDEDSEEQVFAEFDDEKGVAFYPPMYAQRYAAVNDCLLDERWCGKLEKIVDLGYHDMSFIKYLKEVPGVKHIIGVDIETVPLRCSLELLAHGEYVPKRENPLQITLFEGNAADPDYRLIGCDAVVAIEMIEHMLPHDLDRLIHNVFGFIQPQIAVVTTPNSDFNVLFKALESNGLRRWDHLFEWSRGQFHDWCSNVVVRYPNYTVTCKGVGPGPPGTEHYGCCSQLALFISKDYHKQQDLTIDSMALVRNLPNENNLSDVEESWVHSNSLHESNMICAPYDIESFSELPFPEKRSCMTIVIMTSPPIDTLEYRDSTAQCNIDKEIGRGYLMFDEDPSANVVVPSRRIVNRMYEIEDVSSRLNCSMLQVRKFSKVTQNLMAKNKIDSLIQTREVVDEIRQLTKMLNFDKSTMDQQPKMYTWNNINWGENAPYWNQYYNVVRDYNYPFETKTEECRIIDLISDEISNLVDTQCPQEGSAGSEKIEIPLHYLMGVVEHITDDVDKVKDLLEWNGYEVVDNVVIHSRFAMDNISMTTPDNECKDKDNDLYSDWDVTDMHSTSFSNASAISSQQNGKWLQRSLDIKVRKLRSLLTADEDITTELDRVVYRLMKLALKTSKDRDVPPPTTWLQCKLLDLLTLTERAIERRKRLLFNKNPLAVLAPEDQRQNHTLGVFPDINDNDSNNIVGRYTNYLQEADVKEKFNSATSDLHRYVSLEVEDDISVTSNEFVKTYDFNNRENSSSSMNSERNKGKKIKSRERDVSSHKQYHKTDNYSGVSSSGDTDHSIKINHQKRYKKTNKNIKKQSDNEDKSTKIEVIKDNKPKGNLKINNEEYGGRKDRKRLLKRIVKKKKICGYIFKHNQPFVECEHYKLRVKRKIRQHRQVKSILNPSPNNLTNVYQENINPKKTFNELINAICDKRGDPIFKSQESIAFTEQSCVIEIVTDKTSETISLRQTLATNANKCRSQHSNLLLPIKSEARLDSVSILTNNSNCSISKLVLTAEKEESQAIFLYDINEPSTSKGVRHINIDAQCGPDTGFICPVPSVVTSLSRNLINITDPDANKREEEFECIKSDDNKSFKDDNMLNPKIKTNGIQIKDSDNALKKTKENLALISIESLPIVSESASQLAMKLDYHISPVPESSIDANMGNCSKVPSDSVIIAKKINGAIRELPNLPKEIAIANDIPFSSPIQRKLTRGGIYIHSYKDKITSEDIIYQGDWQRLRPKKLAKNNPFDIIFVKKNAEQNNNKKKNKDHLIRKNRGGSNGNSSCNRECQQKINNIIVNKEQNLCTDSKKSVVARKTIKCLNKNLKQVSSKVTVSSVICKNTRNTQEVPKIIKTPQNHKREKKNKNSVKNYKSKNTPPCNPVYIKNRFHKNITQHPALEVNECHVKDYNFLKNLNIKNELLKFVRDPCHTISYSVFRNKIEKDAEGNRQSSPIKEIRNSKEFKSIRNMQSANSSSSSTNSIATIRQLSPQLQMRRKLPSKIKVNNLPKTTSPIRRINTTECTKKTSIIFDDKENDPQSSNYDNIQMKDSTQDLEKSKSIVIPRNSISKHKNKSSNISIKKPHEVTEKKFCTSSSSTSKKVSLADPIPNVVIKKQLHSDPNVSNLVLVLESYKKPPHVEEQKLAGCLQESENRKEPDSRNNTVLSLVDDNGNYVTHDIPDIYHEMMNLVEESLNFIGEHSFIKHSKIGQGKQLSQGERNKNCEKVHFHETIENEAATTSLYSGSTQVNVDLISFKSFASVSGYSEYFLADSELSATLDSLQITTSPKKSVHELFERNDQAHLPYSGTVQGFSGLSINEQLIGDQPDYVNLIDSETGSVARDMDLRRATSEEVFTSGRSSDTYVSCQVDEDTLVPQWLFHAINQQHSEEENEQQRILIPMPVVEPDLDINANIMERGVVAGAGAGDGRGIHSDQDSSGRDTSMSSTETSSGQQSEAVLVDPSAYATNIEFLREPSSRPFFQLGSSASPDSSFRTVEGSENDNAYSVSAGSTRNDLNLGMIQSDRDADVSSLDTDIADFSDN